MNGEGDYGYGDVDQAYLRGDLVTGFQTYLTGYAPPDINLVPLGDLYATINQGIANAQAAGTFGVVAEPGTGGSGGAFEDTGDAPLVQVIDPEFAPKATVAESGGPVLEPQAAPQIYPEVIWEAVKIPDDPSILSPNVIQFPNPFRNSPAVDWDQVYDEYVILNPSPATIEVPVIPPTLEPTATVFEEKLPEPLISEVPSVIDWGDIFTTAIGSVATGLGAPPMQFGAPSPSPQAPMPAKVTVDTRTGRVTPCRRRRRRKLLTESDFNALLRISTLPNKDTVKIALSKALR